MHYTLCFKNGRYFMALKIPACSLKMAPIGLQNTKMKKTNHRKTSSEVSNKKEAVSKRLIYFLQERVYLL